MNNDIFYNLDREEEKEEELPVEEPYGIQENDHGTDKRL